MRQLITVLVLAAVFSACSGGGSDSQSTPDPSDPTSVSPFIDIYSSVVTNGEGGLLSMDFHPDYPDTPEIFLSYTRAGGAMSMRSVITRVFLDNIVTPVPIGSGSMEQEIISVDQFASNHNGGDIAFGPDGFLYFGLGDGGGGSGDAISSLLSETGCVDPSDITRPYAGLVPCGLIAPFWSDGADKSRFLGLPNDTTITIDDQDELSPNGGRLIA